MTKRKTLEEKAARKQAEPRKRVAVSVSKSAATKAMYVALSIGKLEGTPTDLVSQYRKKCVYLTSTGITA